MAGRQLGKGYIVLDRLGSGAFGVVWKARGINTGRLYAIKEIDLTFLSDKEQEECVKEVEMLALLDCPYIIKYYDSFVEQASLYIVTEYAPGGPLSRFLATSKAAGTPLPEPTLWRLLLQILAGVHHMHTKRILHRDIKPHNIFLDDRLHVKIGDLGVSRMLSASTRFAQTLVGTPYYLSPEMCEGAPYDERSDVWALGVVLYEAATYHLPFEGRTQAALALNILRGAYPPLRGYSAELMAIVDRCLCKRRAARPATDKLLLLPSVQRWAATLGIELPLVPQPRRATPSGGHTRAASWSPAADHHGPREAPVPGPKAPASLLHTVGSRLQAKAAAPTTTTTAAVQGHTMVLTQRGEPSRRRAGGLGSPTNEKGPPGAQGRAKGAPGGGATGSPLIRASSGGCAPASKAGELEAALAKQHAVCVRLLGREGLEGLLRGLAAGEAQVAPLAADSPAFRALQSSPDLQRQAVEAVASLVRLQQRLAALHQ